MTSTRDRFPDLAPAEDAAFIEDLLDAHDVDVPALSFRAPARTGRSRSFFSRHWRPVLVAAAVAGVALVIGASTLPGNETAGVSAQEILDRANVAAAQAAGSSLPYHLRAETIVQGEKGGPAGSTSFTSEVWYGGETQYRTEQYAAAGVLSDGQARNGDDTWIFNTGPGGLRVAHGSASVLDFGFGGQVLPNTNSLADVLAVYNQPCMKATVEGDTQVLGRDAYVVRVDFDPRSCAALTGNAKNPRKDTTRITVDKELFLPLATERIDAAGTEQYRYRVVELDLAPAFDASSFVFNAPAGATVTEVSSMLEAKTALAGPIAEKPAGQPGDEVCQAALDTQKALEDKKEDLKPVPCPAKNP